MNEHDNERDADLVQRLHGLPREMIPPARVWAAVAEQVGREGRAAPVRRARRPRMRGRWPVVAGLAAAASVVLMLAIGLMPSMSPAPAVPAGVQQAELMAGQYREALAAVPVDEMPAELAPALAELDQSAASILAAIREAPASGFLLDQLQRTYAQRLQLTRQAAFGATAMI